MAWKLGEAFIRLFADPRQLVADLRRAEGDVEGAAKSMSLTWGSAFKLALIPAAAEAAGHFGRTLREVAIATIEQGDRLRELSQITGVTVEVLSRVEYAGQTAGVGLEEVGNAMRFLNKNLDAAKSGNKAARAAFADLGVSVDEVRSKGLGAIDVFKKIATNISTGNIKVEAATGAMRTMGRAGASMVPLLMEGADGIEELGRRADAAGYTISTDFANDADAFGDAITLMKSDAKGFARVLTEDLMRAVIGIASAVGKTLPDHFTLGKLAAKSLGGVFKIAATMWTTAFFMVSDAVKGAVADVGLFANVLGKAARGDMIGAWNTALQGSAENADRARERTKAYQDSLGKLWGLYGAYDDDQKRRLAEGEDLTDEERSAIEKLNTARQDEIKQLEIKRAELQGNKAEVERLTEAYNQWKIAAELDAGLSPQIAQQTLELQKQNRELDRGVKAKAEAAKKSQEEVERSRRATKQQQEEREALARLNASLVEDFKRVEKQWLDDALQGMERYNDELRETLRLRQEMSAELASLTSSDYDNAKASIDSELAMRRTAIEQSGVSATLQGEMRTQAEAIALEKMRNLNAEYGLDFERMLELQIASFGSVAERMTGMWRDTVNDMTSSLTDIFVAAFTGDLKSIDDIFKNFLQGLLRRIMQFLAEQAVINLLKMLAKSGAGSWWGTLAGTIATGMQGTSKAAANGAVWEGGFRAFASGGVVSTPTLGLIGEGSMNEAIVPLPNGHSIPVELSEKSQEIVINLRNVVTADLLQAGRPSESEIINVFNSDVARRGQTYHQFRRRR